MDESDILQTGVVFLSTEGSKRLRRTCDNCGAPLTVHQGFGTGICDLPRCRAAMVEAVAHEKRERKNTEVQKLEKNLKIDFANDITHTIKEIGATDPDSVIVTILPAQPNSQETTTAERKDAFKTHLNTLLEQTYTDIEPQTDCNEGQETVEPEESDNSRSDWESQEQEERIRAENEAEPHAVMQAACKSCQGFCCKTGGVTAHLGPEDIKRWRKQNPLATVNEACTAYLSLLPEKTTESGCIFQSVDGCALPRTLRSDYCNTYICKDLEKATEFLHDSSTGEIVFISHQNGKSVRISGWSPKAGFTSSQKPRTEGNKPDPTLSW